MGIVNKAKLADAIGETPDEKEIREAEAQISAEPANSIEGEASSDETPIVHTVTVIHQPHGTTTFAARVLDPVQGWVNKNFALPGKVTAKQIGETLSNINNW